MFIKVFDAVRFCMASPAVLDLPKEIYEFQANPKDGELLKWDGLPIEIVSKCTAFSLRSAVKDYYRYKEIADEETLVFRKEKVGTTGDWADYCDGFSHDFITANTFLTFDITWFEMGIPRPVEEFKSKRFFFGRRA